MTLTTIIITLLTFILIILALFMMLVILMQRPNTNAGMGAAFGGGVTEQTFGAETTNVLTRATKWSAVAFFVVSLVLYLLYLTNVRQNLEAAEDDLPDLITEVPVAAPTTLASEMTEGAAGLDALAVETAEETAATVDEGAAAAEDAVEETPVPAPSN